MREGPEGPAAQPPAFPASSVTAQQRRGTAAFENVTKAMVPFPG